MRMLKSVEHKRKRFQKRKKGFVSRKNKLKQWGIEDQCSDENIGKQYRDQFIN